MSMAWKCWRAAGVGLLGVGWFGWFGVGLGGFRVGARSLFRPPLCSQAAMTKSHRER